jgi:hypothetical protein
VWAGAQAQRTTERLSTLAATPSLTLSTRRSGRPGRLPASAPHGSVHAQLRHTALQAMTSPAASQPRPCDAIRRRPVEMVSRLGVPGISPSGGLMARHPLPSAGCLGSVPPRRRYYEVLRLPSTRPAALRCLRLAVSRSHPSFDPPAAGCAGRGPGVGHPVPPAGSLPRRWVGLPGSWGTSVNVPCSPTPAGPRHQAIAASRHGLPLT